MSNRLTSVLGVWLTVLVCLNHATAQEPENGDPDAPAVETRASAVIMARSGEGGEMQIEAFHMPLSGAVSPIGAARMVIGSPMMIGGGGIQSNSIDWMQNDDILTELQIVDEQRDELQKLLDEVNTRRQDFTATIRDLPGDKRIDYIRDFSSLLTTNVDEQIEGILLPHQLKRVKQIQMQTRMRAAGVNYLDNEEFVKLLGITEEQRKELKKKQEEVQKELQKKLEQLRREAREELLSVLTSEQRKKLNKLTGESYEFKPRSLFGSSIKKAMKVEKPTKEKP